MNDISQFVCVCRNEASIVCRSKKLYKSSNDTHSQLRGAQ